MAYVTESEMVAVVPEDVLTVAVDDDGTGIAKEGVWDIVATAAGRRVDAILAARYDVPFSSPYPDLVKDAALTFAAELLYLRKGIAGDANPWSKKAAEVLAHLQKVAKGEMDMDIASTDQAADADVVSEDSKTFSDNENLMV